jgi:hypothetical protein
VEGGCFAKDLEGYGSMALVTGIYLYVGSVVQPGVGLPTGDSERSLKGTPEVGHLSLSMGAL